MLDFQNWVSNNSFNQITQKIMCKERLRLCLVFQKLERKCITKKIKRKSRKKEKMKENKEYI